MAQPNTRAATAGLLASLGCLFFPVVVLPQSGPGSSPPSALDRLWHISILLATTALWTPERKEGQTPLTSSQPAQHRCRLQAPGWLWTQLPRSSASSACLRPETTAAACLPHSGLPGWREQKPLGWLLPPKPAHLLHPQPSFPPLALLSLPLLPQPPHPLSLKPSGLLPTCCGPCLRTSPFPGYRCAPGSSFSHKASRLPFALVP